MEPIGFDGTFDGWVVAARGALQRGKLPSDVVWLDRNQASDTSLFSGVAEEAEAPPIDPSPVSVFRVPKRFLELARSVACHRAPHRWPLLYRVLWRLTHGEAHLLEVGVDPDTHELEGMEKAIGRDLHKMRAFVRFREVKTDDGPWFVAWFEPQHFIVERNAPFFRDRFAALRWSILTPDRCVHWDRAELRFTEGVDRSQAPTEDAVEDLWRTYYGSIFNPARVKVRAMTAEMPRHYWKNLPEAQEIQPLLAKAPTRVEAMYVAAAAKRPVEDFVPFEVPATDDLSLLRDAAKTCRGCPLWKDASCVVFGEGLRSARVLVVGEQPGDQEDRAGRPFVGPAGQLFNRALAAAGIDRAELYVTNAVKHFKWTPQGKRRLHAKPSAREVAACRPWLEAEICAVKPALIVCLGATATGTICGPDLKVTELRGQALDTPFGIPALVTVHPSSLLRLPVGVDPEVEFKRFVEDLRKAKLESI